MFKLITKILILILVLWAIVEVAAYLSKDELDPFNYLSAISSKHERLEATSSPRIIFIGDSSLPFGLDAAVAESELGLPVLNMGLHAAFGMKFIFQEILPDIKEGDTVVMIYHYYPSEDDVNEGVVCHALDFYPEMYKRLQLDILTREKLKITCDLKRTRRFILNKAFGAPSVQEIPLSERQFDYKSWAMNDYGDFYNNLYKNLEIKFTPGYSNFKVVPQDDTISLLNKYQKEYQKRGVKLLLIYPPFPQTSYNDNKEAITEFDRLLREETDIEVLNRPTDSVFPDNYFFNSDYHLTSDGKAEYTKNVIRLLKSALDIKYE